MRYLKERWRQQSLLQNLTSKLFKYIHRSKRHTGLKRNSSFDISVSITTLTHVPTAKFTHWPSLTKEVFKT